MPELDGRIERSRDLERVMTFVDAIAAVAITLLVLPLVDLAGTIASTDGAESETVSHLIRSHSGEFWAFGLSFLVIARLWFAQHSIMRTVIASKRSITIWLLLWTFAIVVLPFPTALLSDAGHQAITKVLYMGTLSASSWCLAFLAVAIGRDRAVRDSDDAPAVAPSAMIAILMLIALGISLIAPGIGYYSLFLLIASDRLASAWQWLLARRRRA
jgi:uncharacterized membrane protein